MARKCGNCSLCCFVPYISKPFKPSHTWCPHRIKGIGCSVYKDPDKPAICDDFECSWKLGAAEEEDRPDKLGFYVTSGSEDEPYGPICQLNAAHKDVFWTERTRLHIERMGISKINIVVGFAAEGQFLLWGPPKKVEFYLEIFDMHEPPTITNRWFCPPPIVQLRLGP